MRCYVFIQTTKLHIFSIYGNFLLFIFYFLKDIRTEEQVFFERHENRRTCFIPQPKNMFFCSSVLPSQAIPMFFCSPVFPKKHVLLSNYHAHFSYSN